MINVARGWTQEGSVIDELTHLSHIHVRRDVFHGEQIYLETDTLEKPGWPGNSYSVALHSDSWAIKKIERLRLMAEWAPAETVPRDRLV
jgi:hypothetical protein